MPVKDENAARTPSGQKSRATGKPRTGRKPRADVAATAILHFRVTPGEEEAIKAAAKAAGLSESAWLRGAVQEALGGPAVRLEWRVYSEAADLCLCIGGFSTSVLQMYPGQWAFSANGGFFGPESEAATKARVVEHVRALGMPVQMPPFPGDKAGSHARQTVTISQETAQ
jgi:hypothetical protein